jgi:tRNA (cytidine/uridine-2'-O-)-methyltransferase
MGFVLSDKELRRSAMDYWPRLKLTLHDETQAFLQFASSHRLWFFSTKGKRTFWDADFRDRDFLIFGSETKGIDDSLLEKSHDHVLRIPQANEERCLNLSTAVGIALYEALHKISK